MLRQVLMPGLELYVRPCCEEMYGASVGIIGGMIHELIVEGDPAIVEDLTLIKELGNIFPAVMRELAVPDHKPVSACCEEVAVWFGEPIGEQRDADVVG